MASKKQKVASGSRNRASSGSNSRSAPTVQKFNTPEALAEFTRLASKAVAKERGLVPAAYEYDMLKTIQDRHWEKFCEQPAAVPLSIVREFYAHAKAEQNGLSWVRGLTVDYRVSNIRAVLGLQHSGIYDDWTFRSRADVDLEDMIARLCVPGTTWIYRTGTTEPVKFSASAMNKYARAWNHFICANIMPSTHPHHVTVERAILLWGILTGKYIDLAKILHQNILRFLSNGSGTIPHASIVMRLCISAGLTWGDDEPLQRPLGPIDHDLIAKFKDWQGGIPREDGLGYEIAEDAGDDAQQEMPWEPQQARAGPSQAQQDAVRAYLDSQFRRTNRRTDALYEAHRKFSTDLTSALSTAFQTPGSSVTWPVFGSHAEYPPLNSPSEPSEEDDSEDE